METADPTTGEVSTSPMQSPSIAKLAEALAKAQGKIKGATKDTENPFFKSKYADLASIWDACREHLAAQGLAVIQTMANGVGNVTIITTLAHSSGEWIRGDLTLKPVKDDPQGVGSAITYGRRYALAAMVGVAPDDDDGNAASGKASGNSSSPGGPRQAAPKQEAEPWKGMAETIKKSIDEARDNTELDGVMKGATNHLATIKAKSETAYNFLMDRSNKRAAALSQAPSEAA